jgi:hypothetical protein
MPPKRKALAETTINMDAPTKSRNAKASKTSLESSAPTSSAPKPSAPKSTDKTKTRTFKYSNANTVGVPIPPKPYCVQSLTLSSTKLSKKPSYVNLQWPNIGDFIDDKDQDMPKEGETLDKWCDRVSDLGIPVSNYGMELCEKLVKECEKRNQDMEGIYIYNDWNGWGMSEVMENHLKDFNRDIFKKTLSPYQKFAYVEAFACFVMMEDLMEWISEPLSPIFCRI